MANDMSFTTLGAEDFDALTEALDKPPAPTPALIDMMTRYRSKVASGEIIVDDRDEDITNIFVENDSVD